MLPAPEFQPSSLDYAQDVLQPPGEFCQRAVVYETIHRQCSGCVGVPPCLSSSTVRGTPSSLTSCIASLLCPSAALTLRSPQLVQQGLGLLQVDGVKPLGEPAIDCRMVEKLDIANCCGKDLWPPTLSHQ